MCGPRMHSRTGMRKPDARDSALNLWGVRQWREFGHQGRALEKGITRRKEWKLGYVEHV